MIGTILSCICAVVLCAASPSVQADTIDVYVIDYVDVNDFDGTQLVGKTISTYNVSLTGNGSRTVRRHTIKTVLSDKKVQDGTGEMSSDTDILLRSNPDGKNTTNVYFIDNVKVKSFSGSQLNGKTVSSYEMTVTDTGSETVRTHMIETAPMGNTINTTTTSVSSGFSSEMSSFLDQIDTQNAVILVNGIVVSEEAFRALNFREITGIEEMRGRSAAEFLQNLKEEGKYDGKTEGKGVVTVTTRQQQ